VGVTLDELRRYFWWLGPGKPGSNILSLEGAVVTIKVIQSSWNRRTQQYEAAVARDFAALGLTVSWVPFWSEGLQAQIDEAREEARKKGKPFDEAAFVARKQQEERT
jgi:hypothetical protein